MKLLHVSMLTLIVLTGCSTKDVTLNGLICPDNHTQQMVQRDLSECHYYDEKAVKNSATPKLSDKCKECLIKRGYEIE